jgi:hypothetical protein
MVILKTKKINNKDINGNDKKGHLKKILNIFTKLGNIVLKEITNDNISDDDEEENNDFAIERTPLKVSCKIKKRTLTLSVS